MQSTYYTVIHILKGIKQRRMNIEKWMHGHYKELSREKSTLKYGG